MTPATSTRTRSTPQQVKTSVPAVERVHPPLWAISHLVNPIVRRVMRHSHGSMSRYFLLLGFNGRRTGRRYEVPVAYRMVDGRLAIFTNSGWRHNFIGGADVEVTIRGERQRAHASITSDPREVASIYRESIDDSTESDISVTYQQLGIKVNVHRLPTVEELRSMAETSGLSIVWLDLMPA